MADDSPFVPVDDSPFVPVVDDDPFVPVEEPAPTPPPPVVVPVVPAAEDVQEAARMRAAEMSRGRAPVRGLRPAQVREAFERDLPLQAEVLAPSPPARREVQRTLVAAHQPLQTEEERGVVERMWKGALSGLFGAMQAADAVTFRPAASLIGGARDVAQFAAELRRGERVSERPGAEVKFTLEQGVRTRMLRPGAVDDVFAAWGDLAEMSLFVEDIVKGEDSVLRLRGGPAAEASRSAVDLLYDQSIGPTLEAQTDLVYRALADSGLENLTPADVLRGDLFREMGPAWTDLDDAGRDALLAERLAKLSPDQIAGLEGRAEQRGTAMRRRIVADATAQAIDQGTQGARMIWSVPLSLPIDVTLPIQGGFGVTGRASRTVRASGARAALDALPVEEAAGLPVERLSEALGATGIRFTGAGEEALQTALVGRIRVEPRYQAAADAVAGLSSRRAALERPPGSPAPTTAEEIARSRATAAERQATTDALQAAVDDLRVLQDQGRQRAIVETLQYIDEMTRGGAPVWLGPTTLDAFADLAARARRADDPAAFRARFREEAVGAAARGQALVSVGEGGVEFGPGVRLVSRLDSLGHRALLSLMQVVPGIRWVEGVRRNLVSSFVRRGTPMYAGPDLTGRWRAFRRAEVGHPALWAVLRDDLQQIETGVGLVADTRRAGLRAFQDAVPEASTRAAILEEAVRFAPEGQAESLAAAREWVGSVVRRGEVLGGPALRAAAQEEAALAVVARWPRLYDDLVGALGQEGGSRVLRASAERLMADAAEEMAATARASLQRRLAWWSSGGAPRIGPEVLAGIDAAFGEVLAPLTRGLRGGRANLIAAMPENNREILTAFGALDERLRALEDLARLDEANASNTLLRAIDPLEDPGFGEALAAALPHAPFGVPILAARGVPLQLDSGQLAELLGAAAASKGDTVALRAGRRAALKQPKQIHVSGDVVGIDGSNGWVVVFRRDGQPLSETFRERVRFRGYDPPQGGWWWSSASDSRARPGPAKSKVVTAKTIVGDAVDAKVHSNATAQAWVQHADDELRAAVARGEGRVAQAVAEVRRLAVEAGARRQRASAERVLDPLRADVEAGLSAHRAGRADSEALRRLEGLEGAARTGLLAAVRGDAAALGRVTVDGDKSLVSWVRSVLVDHLRALGVRGLLDPARERAVFANMNLSEVLDQVVARKRRGDVTVGERYAGSGGVLYPSTIARLEREGEAAWATAGLGLREQFVREYVASAAAWTADPVPLLDRLGERVERGQKLAAFIDEIHATYPLTAAAARGVVDDTTAAALGLRRLSSGVMARRVSLPPDVPPGAAAALQDLMGAGRGEGEVLARLRELGHEPTAGLRREVREAFRPEYVPVHAAEYLEWMYGRRGAAAEAHSLPHPALEVWDAIHAWGKGMLTVARGFGGYFATNVAGNLFSGVQRLGVEALSPTNHVAAALMQAVGSARRFGGEAGAALGRITVPLADGRRIAVGQLYDEAVQDGALPPSGFAQEVLGVAGTGPRVGTGEVVVPTQIGGEARLGEAVAAFPARRGTPGDLVGWLSGRLTGLDGPTVRRLWNLDFGVKGAVLEALNRASGAAVGWFVTGGSPIGGILGALTSRGWLNLMGWLNEVIETKARLTVYVAARRAGAPRAEAVGTVNDVLRNYADQTPLERDVTGRIFQFQTWELGNIRFQGKMLARDWIKYAETLRILHMAYSVHFDRDEVAALPNWLRWRLLVRTGQSGGVVALPALPPTAVPETAAEFPSNPARRLTALPKWALSAMLGFSVDREERLEELTRFGGAPGWQAELMEAFPTALRDFVGMRSEQVPAFRDRPQRTVIRVDRPRNWHLVQSLPLWAVLRSYLTVYLPHNPGGPLGVDRQDWINTLGGKPLSDEEIRRRMEMADWLLTRELLEDLARFGVASEKFTIRRPEPEPLPETAEPR